MSSGMTPTIYLLAVFFYLENDEILSVTGKEVQSGRY
jgi:hypothetical protein